MRAGKGLRQEMPRDARQLMVGRTGNAVPLQRQQLLKDRGGFSLSGLSGLRRPDGAPAVGVHCLTREYLARAPGIAVVALHESAVVTGLIGRWIGSRRSVNGGRVVRVFHRLCHGIVFR